MMNAPWSVYLARSATAAAPFALAIAIGAVALAATGHEPLAVYQLMVEEAFGGERRIAATLTAATPLLLTGLAAAIAFRAGIFNVGAEGCFYLGGMAAAVVGYASPNWPSTLLIPLALAASGLVGGAWLLGPGLLRARLGVDEVVTTLMLNFIAVDLTSWLVNGPMLARGSANSATPQIVSNAELPRLLPPTTLHLGFVLSLSLVVAYGFWSRFTVEGFRTRRRDRPVEHICRRHDRLRHDRRPRRRHSCARPCSSLCRWLLSWLRLHWSGDRAARAQFGIRGCACSHSFRRSLLSWRQYPVIQ